MSDPTAAEPEAEPTASEEQAPPEVPADDARPFMLLRFSPDSGIELQVREGTMARFWAAAGLLQKIGDRMYDEQRDAAMQREIASRMETLKVAEMLRNPGGLRGPGKH